MDLLWEGGGEERERKRCGKREDRKGGGARGHWDRQLGTGLGWRGGEGARREGQAGSLRVSSERGQHGEVDRPPAGVSRPCSPDPRPSLRAAQGVSANQRVLPPGLPSSLPLSRPLPARVGPSRWSDRNVSRLSLA